MRTHSSDVKSYFDQIELYLAGNAIVGLRAWLLRKEIGAVRDMQILDAGCGDGSLTRSFLDANHVTFLDLSEEMLARARSQLSPQEIENARFISGDLLRTELDRQFNLILLIGVIAHIDGVGSALRKIHGTLTPDGRAFVQVSDDNHPLTAFNTFLNRLLLIDRRSYSFNRFTPESFERLLDEHGMTVVSKTRYFPVRPLFTLIPKNRRLRAMIGFHRDPLRARYGSELIYCLAKS